MVEIGLDDVSLEARAAMGVRMELAVAPARLQMIGHAVLDASRRATRALVGDGIGIIASVDPGAAAFFMQNKYQSPEQEPPAAEA